MRNDSGANSVIMGVFILIIIAVGAVGFVMISSQFNSQLNDVIADPINNTGILGPGVGENVSLYENISTMYNDPANISTYGQVRIATNVISTNLFIGILLAFILVFVLIFSYVYAMSKV
jgi:hypothetical protein